MSRVGIDQFQPPAELEPEELAILMQLWRFTCAKYDLIFGLDTKAESVLVGVESPIPGMLGAPVPIITLAVNNATNRFTHVKEPYRHAWAKYMALLKVGS